MAQVGARVATTDGALAGGVGRGLVFSELFVLDVEAALAGEEQGVAGGAGGKNAIHHVDAHSSVLLDFVGVADAHDVARLVFGQQRQHFRDHFEGELAGLANAEPADGVAVEVHFDEALGALAAEIAVHAALNDAKKALRATAVAPSGGWRCGRGRPHDSRRATPATRTCRWGPRRGRRRYKIVVVPGSFVAVGAEVVERAARPGHGETEAFFGAGAIGGVLGALVEGHDDVGAEGDLDVDGVLRGEEMRAAVEV
jgi:hypothetical protein